ncbi:Cofilin/tropomyosin-type actin-binding protein [Onchocerca flexuosa]|uniref:Twinfilin n=2 Tax=Onchocerca flexuosa TaxID=387005 RepID=A0A238BS45_9BILA|nr:Cofilin/tropomyosin-type actin-binding protein [Onchocerca flexuosa]
MACQSGIRASDKLLRFFNECKSGKIRLAKIVVKNEELCVNFQGKGTADWRADFKRHLPDCIDAFEPCYILFRIDEPYGWILMSFADDRAPVREKMVFAATWATFKSEFGQSNIRYEYHVTDKKEMTLEAFEKWLSSKEDLGPMSELEKEFYNAHQELKVTVPSVVAAQTVRGVFFPVDQDAEEELRKLTNHTVNYVQLAVDTLNEAIKLECSKPSISPEQLNEVIPRDKPRYHFYRFSHKYNDQDYDSLFLFSVAVFIYSMPSSGCTIKERMLYSSCKQPFLQAALSAANLSPDKKIEIDSKELLSSDILIDYTHPAPQMKEKSFAKPPGPSQRGARRVTKAVS